MKSSCLGFINVMVIIGAIIITVVFVSMVNTQHKQEITKRITSSGNVIVNIESKELLSHTPFKWVDKNDRIYKFTYKTKDGLKTGWVRFRIFNTDWLMDYKE